MTCLFNPAGYRRRLENYRVFRERLGAPLVTVELSCDGRFDLGPGDAEVLVQMRGESVLWQKERLLNVALAHLPAECSSVAWLDCDIVFTRPDWVAAVAEGLRRSRLCQVFRKLYHLAPDSPLDKEHAIANAWSFAHGIALGETIGPEAALANGSYKRGNGWAAGRRVLERTGLYDRAVIGSGDTYMAFAAVGRWEEAIAYYGCSAAQASDYREWAKAFHAAVDSHVGCVDTEVLHLWHGDLGNRRYDQRHTLLSDHGFDPRADLAIDGEGCWRWNSPKHEMHRAVQDYFRDRKEDGE